MPLTTKAAILGTLLGAAVGDAMGLPYEGLSARRGQRLWGPPTQYRFLGHRGMISDDAEHTCLVAQALCRGGEDVEAFRRALAWGLRRWLASGALGWGRATLLACLKLLVGVSPRHSGIRSAGNGPAMRSHIIGVAITDPTRLAATVQASSRMTHTDTRADHGALAVALAAQCAAQGRSGEEFLALCRDRLPEDSAQELLDRVAQAAASAARGERPPQFAAALGYETGVPGYINATVPLAIQAWLRYRDNFEQAMIDIIESGGDTDTGASIAGGILGAGLGPQGIPERWLATLAEWPRNRAWFDRLADALADSVTQGQAVRPPSAGLGVIPRNLLFFAVIVVHVLRRRLPPY